MESTNRMEILAEDRDKKLTKWKKIVTILE